MTKSNTSDFAPIKVESLPTKLADIKALIADAAIKGNAVQVQFQVAGCAVIQHLGKHKDIRVARDMLASIPEGMRVDSMAKWLELYAPVSIDEEGELHYNADKPVKLGNALEKAWWKAKPITKYVPYNFIDELEKTLDKASKRYGSNMAKGTSKEDDITAQDLNLLRELISNAKKTDARLAIAA